MLGPTHQANERLVLGVGDMTVEVSQLGFRVEKPRQLENGCATLIRARRVANLLRHEAHDQRASVDEQLPAVPQETLGVLISRSSPYSQQLSHVLHGIDAAVHKGGQAQGNRTLNR